MARVRRQIHGERVRRLLRQAPVVALLGARQVGKSTLAREIAAELRRHLGARREECFFWATHAGAELDLLVVRGAHRYGFGVKRTDAPSITPSMKSAIASLRLDHLDVIHAGRRTFALSPDIRAVAAADLLTAIHPLPA
jgi:predicted AAA+ superfamily ATPase